MINNSFQILYDDDSFVAINKPTGILVHRTRISEDTTFVLQLLRNQLGHRIYPVHRLDRPTSGVLLFGKTKEAAGLLSDLMRKKEMTKKYLGVVRGYVEEEGTIDYPLIGKEHLPAQEAITHYTKLAQVEKEFSISRYPTSRYSLVEITLDTGRRHQIRRHFAHLRHPVIGDKRHGDCKHNKFFREQLEINRMLLHAGSLQFLNPNNQKLLTIESPVDEEFKKVINWFVF